MKFRKNSTGNTGNVCWRHSERDEDEIFRHRASGFFHVRAEIRFPVRRRRVRQPLPVPDRPSRWRYVELSFIKIFMIYFVKSDIIFIFFKFCSHYQIAHVGDGKFESLLKYNFLLYIFQGWAYFVRLDIIFLFF